MLLVARSRLRIDLLPMEDTLRVINNLEAEKIIGRYAIGGAIGFLFYVEPSFTDDLDIFCYLPTSQSGLTNLEPLSARVQELGYQFRAAHIMIEGIPVQFLHPPTKLVEEALELAIPDKYGETDTRVFTYEHLLAIAADLGRVKDKARIAGALESREPDWSKLKDILQRHNLAEKWSKITA